MINNLLNEENVDINVDAKSWQEAIEKVGYLLLANNKIEKRYIDSMIDTVNNMGPYIVMAKGIAMPHSRPEHGAKETSLSIITLKEPVEFGNEDFDPVTMVIGLSSVDSKSHLELLSDLSNIIDDEELIEKAKCCKSKSELITLINEVYSENI
ncbi:PTS transporter subunit EIIA [Romboutsia sp. CE17]|uniref:PTS sugar transporter subunit IIA n=1 Tax=Romboutsia sp. CE17 TaxID=2724150 RepID=UPI001442DA0C|nr:PTS sugar transporter subunit IIA [Romboutsia sp. CE17]QJA07480.1 PTS transporter subunit EIIA [Romboutsia sp. CE17]